MPDQQRRARIAVQAEGLVRREIAARSDTDLQPDAASRSSTAASSATRIGNSSGNVTMPVPSRMRVVREAAWARNTKGDGRPPSSS